MPVTPLTNSALPPFVPRFNSVAQVTPFTLRDGSTFLSILTELEKYVTDLTPELNKRLELVYTAITAMEENWRDLFDGFIIDVYAHLSEMNRQVVNQFIVEKFAPLFVNPMDPPFNAKFDGVTDDSAAIQAALNVGGTIRFPNRPTRAMNLAIGSDTEVILGPKTVVTIPDGAPWSARGFYFKNGSTRSSLRGGTVDGNQAKRNHALDARGGIYGTNVSVVQSTHIYIDNVRSINAVQHCFDVTGDQYYDLGDGPVAPNQSSFVWITNCYAESSGDDAFTTHGSHNVWFTHCTARKTWKAPLYLYNNNNGFEPDDYSSDITFTNCHAEEFAHGFDVKAHTTMSASQNIRLIGCTAQYNEYNYHIRHIGHHVNYPGKPAVKTLTGKNVQLIGCTSRHPRRVFTGGQDANANIPANTTVPGRHYHGLVVGAYRGVVATNFTHIGDPAYDYAGSSPILFHFLCEDVVLDGYHVSGCITSTYDVYATGGGQSARNITIANGVHRDSAPSAISCGSEANALINNIAISRKVAGSPNLYGVRAWGDCTVRGVRISKYGDPFTTPFQIRTGLYSSYETPIAEAVQIGTAPIEETGDTGEDGT